MPRVTGSVTLYFENLYFEDEGDMSLRDQAIDALRMEVSGEIVDVEIDTLDEGGEK